MTTRFLTAGAMVLAVLFGLAIAAGLNSAAQRVAAAGWIEACR